MDANRSLKMTLVMIVALVVSLGTAAQSTVVAADEAPQVSVAQTASTLTAFLDAVYRGRPYETFFTDDVVITLGDGPEIIGPTAATQAIDRLLGATFDGSAAVMSVVVGTGQAAIEAEYVDPAIGAFTGFAPIARHHGVPYVIVSELGDGKITALRIYGLPSGLVPQLLATPAATAETDDTWYRPGQPH